MKIVTLEELNQIKQKGLKKILPDKPRVSVGMGTCGIGNGALDVYQAFAKVFAEKSMDVYLTKTGCFGFCAEEPLVNIYLPGQPLVILHKVTAAEVPSIVRMIAEKKIPVKKALCKIEEWDFLTGKIVFGHGFAEIPTWNETPFFKGQKKIVLRDCGLINPEDIEEYIAVGGYDSLYKVLHEFSPERVIDEVKKSKLRGRGGAGFPTGIKWELMRKEKADKKYVICNADEGDPGAYMNRNEIESDPHMIIEGMLIAGFAMGADEGSFYIRAEYPLAVERLQQAIKSAGAAGLLGRNILGSDFNFEITLTEGAGAFVCGEETALIASAEGRAGRPQPRPPFPAQKGLFGKPTNINNVETLANIPVIMARGGEWLTQIGTQKSAGTKVFSLVGKIKNTGLVELPLGTPLKTIIYNIGGGTGTGKLVKSVQSGGPSGGCIPVELFDTPVDYESLNSLGAIMGSGGMVVMDEDNCMVDVARYFTEFTTCESCGKCTPCREGLFQALKILKLVTEGKATNRDLDSLQTLAEVISDTALCGLGQTGPNPILTTLKYFRKEYEAHINNQRCQAGVCGELFLSPCENSCPLHMNIPGFLTLLKEKRLDEAFESVIRDNPLPATTGRICPLHCQARCRREDVDEPLSPGEIHRFIADTIYQGKKEAKIYSQIIKEKLPKTNKKVAIIGAGPAGLTAAFYLQRLGHQVTILEAKTEAGGVLRYGIPEYRLPKTVLSKEIAFIKKLGVKFIFNKKVDAQELKAMEERYDAIFVGTGAAKNMPLGIPGDNFKGVLSGIVFLEEVLTNKEPRIGKNVVVIGAGNVAIDAARTAARLGASVTIVYRREKDDMPAHEDEIHGAEEEGVKFVFLAAPKSVLADATGSVKGIEISKVVPGAYDFSGRKKPVITDQTEEIPCDTVIVAIGERVESGFLKEYGIALNNNGTIQVDRMTCQTNLFKIFAGGDLCLGPATAVEAMAQGKEAAAYIDWTLTGQDRFNTLFKKFDYENEVPLKPIGTRCAPERLLDVKARKNNFRQVSLGLLCPQAEKEVARCLRCDVKENGDGHE